MNIGLVLSGGMAKGAYQIGALRALSAYIPQKEISFISCASVGVLNGYAYATGKLDAAEMIWKESVDENQRILINQMLRSSLLQRRIQDIYGEEDVLSSTFFGVLLDVKHQKIVYQNFASISHQKIVNYLRACVAMPICNRAIRINGIPYFDGAMVDNIPVYPLLRQKLDYVVCIYFDDVYYRFENAEFDRSVIKLTFPSKSIVNESLIFRRNAINQMVEDGYQRTCEQLDEVFQKGYQDRDFIYQAIQKRDHEHTPTLRLTGDVMVSGLNRFAQKFAKRRIEI